MENNNYVNKYIKNKEKLFIHIYTKAGEHKGRLVVDASELKNVKKYTWSFSSTGYARGTINGKIMYLHTFLIGKKKSLVTDHINRNKCDNRKINLRFVTRLKNNMNRDASGIRMTVCGKWNARIRYNGKEHHIGNYNSKIDARNAYLEEKERLLKILI